MPAGGVMPGGGPARYAAPGAALLDLAPPSGPAAPSAPPRRSLGHGAGPGALLQGRWRLSRDRILFEDNVSTIYRTRDVKGDREVAVKVYRRSDAIALQKFRRSVELLLTFRGRFDAKGCRMEGSQTLELLLEELRAHVDLSEHASGHSFITSMDFRSCFVELISFSHDQDWMPAVDPETEALFIVLELGEMSLRDRMTECIHHRQTLSADELNQIHWALVTMVCGLHTEGYLHLDIKPSTLFRYRTAKGTEQWKLIDLDATVKTGSQVRLQELTYATEYAPPELAQLYLKGQREGGRIRLTRGMNVWSAGMCALEAVALMPVFNVKYAWYEKWKQTKGGTTNFLASIASERSSLGVDKMIPQELHDAMACVSKDMASFIEGMLVKDEQRRLTITQCLLHRWFADKRQAILDARWGLQNVDDEDGAASMVPMGSRKSNKADGELSLETATPEQLRAYIKAQLARNAAADGPAPGCPKAAGPTAPLGPVTSRPGGVPEEGSRKARTCALM